MLHRRASKSRHHIPVLPQPGQSSLVVSLGAYLFVSLSRGALCGPRLGIAPFSYLSHAPIDLVALNRDLADLKVRPRLMDGIFPRFGWGRRRAERFVFGDVVKLWHLVAIRRIIALPVRP
ncbi:MAG TPA: hypothetical protein VGM20_05635 [Gemmatimonadales bacterium]